MRVVVRESGGEQEDSDRCFRKGVRHLPDSYSSPSDSSSAMSVGERDTHTQTVGTRTRHVAHAQCIKQCKRNVSIRVTPTPRQTAAAHSSPSHEQLLDNACGQQPMHFLISVRMLLYAPPFRQKAPTQKRRSSRAIAARLRDKAERKVKLQSFSPHPQAGIPCLRGVSCSFAVCCISKIRHFSPSALAKLAPPRSTVQRGDRQQNIHDRVQDGANANSARARYERRVLGLPWFENYYYVRVRKCRNAKIPYHGPFLFFLKRN